MIDDSATKLFRLTSYRTRSHPTLQVHPSVTGQSLSSQNTILPTTTLQPTQRLYKCDRPAAGASCTSKRGGHQDARTPRRGASPVTRRASLSNPRSDSCNGSHFQYHSYSSAYYPSTPKNEAPYARRHTDQWCHTIHLSLPIYVGEEAAK